MTQRKSIRIAALGIAIVSAFTLGILIFSSSSGVEAAQGSPDRIWNEVSVASLVAPAGTRVLAPVKYRAVSINTSALQMTLARAPMEFTPAAVAGRVEITLPKPDGGYARFAAEESPVMEPVLAAKFPLIKTYRAQGLDDRTATARFGVSPSGFHAIVLSPSGTYYIDPFRRGDTVNHISYFTRDYPNLSPEPFECQVFDKNGQPAAPLSASRAASLAAARPNGGNLKTYRLALAADFEYCDFHSDDTIPDKAEVMANGIIPTVNRVNSIYEREVAVHMNLVANNDLILFNTPADPYVDNNGTQMLAANQATCDALIGPLNYDIGHVVSTGGGGVAFLGVICSVQKAGGVTGLPQPTGDPFHVDYVAHEMGHQFGGNHTFNGTSGSCSGNEGASTAYEVGSGSTIQAYAGICTGQNLQPNSDDYFHGASYDEILDHIGSDGGTCAVTTSTGNNAPVVEAGTNYNIPKLTPFTLTASGSDPDGDSITYCWEEFDLGPGNDGRTDNGSSPILRSFNPTASPSRTFPRLGDLLNNTTRYGEILPATERELKFRVTVRDNRANGGGVNYDSMKVNVTDDAGPFVVSYPDGGEIWDQGETRTITWDVANTNAAPVNAANVDIALSLDGGLTFPVVLAAGVPNDGSQDVTVPSDSSGTARVRVMGSGNVFFDLSNANFMINPPPLPPIALNDVATTPFRTPVIVPVLTNDSDPEGGSLSISSVQATTDQGGTAVVDDNGTPSNASDDRVRYTPAPFFSGIDELNYTVSDGGLTATATVTITVISFCPPQPTGNFNANFESDANGFTVSTPANAPQSVPWTRGPDPTAHSPIFSFFTDNAMVNGAVKADRLISPPQYISSTTRLIFWHRFYLEADYDAGVLEVSTDGGVTYADVTSLGGVFISGAYNTLMPEGGPLAGRMAWNGTSPGVLDGVMDKVEIDVGALAGQTVVFRWNFRADDLNTSEAVGWWVDDIQFTNLLVEAPSCNTPPLALDQSVSTNEDTPAGITLTADQGGETDALNFNVQDAPDHGSLSGTAPNLTYTPAANYSGTDTFTFTASDGPNTSNVGTVTITVNAVNQTRTNYALAANGSSIVASSSHLSGLYPASAVINGDRIGNGWGTLSGGWNDGTRNGYPDSLEITFSSARTIDEINVVTLQNGWLNGGEPTLNTLATGEGILDFNVQYWNGQQWVTIPNGSVTGNDKAWRQFTFAPVTTTKVRLFITASRNNWSRVVELEAVGAAAP
ncbi:MAG TPA: zinc-dependent metalloprotease family protein [Pyrinomonadaceae bacterium]|nr:zinc-dependent metalloprotease family protein [Pyrinomonadaceae bacterium]